LKINPDNEYLIVADVLLGSVGLADYKVIEREPLKGKYRGYDVYTMNPPSSGVTLIEMLNILEGYELRDLGHNSALYLHLLTEAMRLSQIDRTKYIGDPAFKPDIPVDRLISKTYAAELREQISPEESGVSSPKDVLFQFESNETTHYSIVDNEGNAVSVTYTINGDFGCEIVADGTGMVLNNEMADFNCKPGVIGTIPNLIEPWKRPLSSMIPTVFSLEKRPTLVLGSPGGRTIPNVVLQIALNFIDHGFNIKDAVAAKRIHHSWMPDYTILEEGVASDETLKKYKIMGHKIYDKEYPLGTAMCIHIDWENRIYYGAADPRSGDPSAFSVEQYD